MPLRFEELKATQATAILLKLSNGSENYLKILDLLYLADRQHILEEGRPFIGTEFYKIRTGPVANEIYVRLNGLVTEGIWFDHIKFDGEELKLIKDPGDGELNDYQVEDILECLHSKYRYWSNETMSKLFDKFRELSDNKSNRPISLNAIWKAENVSDENIRNYKALNEQW